MHTLKLEVSDSLLTKVIAFINTLPKSDVKLLSKQQTNNQIFKSVSIKTKGYKFNRDEANAR